MAGRHRPPLPPLSRLALPAPACITAPIHSDSRLFDTTVVMLSRQAGN